MRFRPRAIALVAGLELRQRVRSIRWYVALGIWFVFLLGMSALITVAMLWMTGDPSSAMPGATVAAIVFSFSVLLLIFAMLLVIPALASGAINGDRTAGTLATLQATLLSPLEIVVGKVLAGWATGLAFLVAALPSIVPSALIAGNSVFYLARVIIAIAFITLCITAVGVGLSSLTSRQLGSVVLSYLVVLGTTVILPVVYVCTLPMLSTTREVTVYEAEYGPVGGGDEFDEVSCQKSVQQMPIVRTDLTLPLLWVNPLVIVSDMAPIPKSGVVDSSPGTVDALVLIGTGVRYLAHPTDPSHFVMCYDTSIPGYPTDLASPTSIPVWPFGAALYLVAGAGGIAVATWRIRTPMRRVGAGTRIA